MFRSAPGVGEIEIGGGPVDEPRTETGRRVASGLRSAFGEESGDVVEVDV